MNALNAALSTLTILPFGRHTIFSEKDLSASVFFFPGVGLFIGAILLGFTLVLHPQVSALPLAALTLCLSVVLTGALHLDGLADLCDGLGAGGNPQRILSVMKESHIGAFGVIALIVTLLLKFTLFYEVIDKGRLNSFLLMGLLSRWTMVFAAFLGKYPREMGTGKALIGKITRAQCMMTTIITMILSWLILKESSLITMGFLALWTLLFVRMLHTKIGGLTGDCLGALNETSEVLVLLFIVIVMPFIESP